MAPPEVSEDVIDPDGSHREQTNGDIDPMVAALEPALVAYGVDRNTELIGESEDLVASLGTDQRLQGGGGRAQNAPRKCFIQPLTMGHEP